MRHMLRCDEATAAMIKSGMDCYALVMRDLRKGIESEHVNIHMIREEQLALSNAFFEEQEPEPISVEPPNTNKKKRKRTSKK